MVSFTSLCVALSTALLARATSSADLVGSGKILVVKSDDWTKASPAATVGCLRDDGRFISTPTNSTAACGVFHLMPDYPYTMWTDKGNCTFWDTTQEANLDNPYGHNMYAYHCASSWVADISSELYTINGFNYLWLCAGDVDCYYDAKTIPAPGESTSLWQFAWGSQQLGITPGHVELQLLWSSVSAPKREAKAKAAPRIPLLDVQQVALRGLESQL